MKTLQSVIKASETDELVLGYYCPKRDIIFVCKNGKIIKRLAGWAMPYFINKYVADEA